MIFQQVVIVLKRNSDETQSVFFRKLFITKDTCSFVNQHKLPFKIWDQPGLAFGGVFFIEEDSFVRIPRICSPRDSNFGCWKSYCYLNQYASIRPSETALSTMLAHTLSYLKFLLAHHIRLESHSYNALSNSNCLKRNRWSTKHIFRESMVNSFKHILVYAYEADYLDFKFDSIIEIDNDNSLADKLTNWKYLLWEIKAKLM
jgi:hypothetical protein